MAVTSSRTEPNDLGSGTELAPRPEGQTLRDVFYRDKSPALAITLQLNEFIAEMELNGWFGNDPATDDQRPMRELRLARQLCGALENLECLKLIMAKESRASMGPAMHRT